MRVLGVLEVGGGKGKGGDLRGVETYGHEEAAEAYVGGEAFAYAGAFPYYAHDPVFRAAAKLVQFWKSANFQVVRRGGSEKDESVGKSISGGFKETRRRGGRGGRGERERERAEGTYPSFLRSSQPGMMPWM